MGCLLVILIVLVVTLSGLLFPLLVGAGWFLAGILALLLLAWLIARVIGIALLPLAWLADGISSDRRANKRGAPRGWPGEIPNRGDPNFDEYLAWANREETEGRQWNDQATRPKQTERRSSLEQFVRKGRGAKGD